MKTLIVASSLSAFYLLLQGVLVDAQEHSNKTEFDELVQRGHHLLDQGHPSEALRVWQKSLAGYEDIGDREGVKGTLVNQAIAYMRLGKYSNACTNLVTALELEPKICQTRLGSIFPLQVSQLQLKQLIQKNSDKTLVVAGFQNLGHTLRQLGKLEDSSTALHHALEIAQQLKQPTEPILLSLANTKRSFFSKNHNIDLDEGDKLSRTKAVYEGQENALEAFQIYEKLSKGSESYSVIARINWLSQYSELIEWLYSEDEALVPKLVNLEKSTTPQAEHLVKELKNADFNGTSPIDEVFNRLRFSRAILSLSESKSKLIDNNTILVAFNQAQAALVSSRRLGNQRGESEALGMIGKIYEHNNQTALAQEAYEKANALAVLLQANDLNYQWQWALGRLAHTSGQTEQATKYYLGSIKNLEQVRKELLFVNSELQYTFRKTVEPVYKQYIELLLEQSSPNLQAVVDSEETLQKAEVENYLQCGQLNLTPLSKAVSSIDKANRPSIFYVLDLGDRYAVIVTDPSGKLHSYFPNYQRVLEASTKLKVSVEDRRFRNVETRRFLPYAKVLYDELIAPAEQSGYVPKQRTLVFVEDAFIQNIPIAMLYDGQKYLVEKHSVSVTLGSGLRNPQGLEMEKAQAIFAGLSKSAPSFNLSNVPKGLEPIPDSEKEGDDIGGLVKTSQLLNESFTWKRLKDNLSPKIQILHVSTHGQFSSNPDHTFLLAWDKTINSLQVRNLLRGKMDDPTLELLFLSACETATGDKRSTLGIAGIAAQSGARSTVATLWKIDSESTQDLVKSFYSALLDPKVINSKAIALQKSQVALINSDEYRHPYYWASFVLVGSWL